MTNKELYQQAVKLLGEDELSRRFRTWITNIIRVARMKASNLDSGALYEADILSILSDLNTRTKSRFQATDAAKSLILARMKQGYQVEDFYHVHEIKCIEWLGNEVMEHNLRPSTLYRPSHFDEYLAAWYKMDRARQELAEKRSHSASRGIPASSQERSGDVPVGSIPSSQSLERQAKITQLMATPWHAFDTWASFMRHTVQFPDAAALAQYPMPPRIRAMRNCPNNSMMKIYRGQRIESLEAEYATLKVEQDANPAKSPGGN